MVEEDRSEDNKPGMVPAEDLSVVPAHGCRPELPGAVIEKDAEVACQAHMSSATSSACLRLHAL